MLISHFCFSLDASRGGVPAGVTMSAKHLSNHGIRNQIISTGNTTTQLEKNFGNFRDLRGIGVEIFYTIARFQNEYGIGSFRGLKKYLMDMPKPDLIVLHQVYTFSTILGYWYAKKFGIPFVVQPHGSLTNYHESDNKILKAFSKKLIISRILHDSSAVIVTCLSEKKDLAASLQFKARSIRYGAVIPADLTMNSRYEQKSTDDLRIIFSGRFDKKKNLPLLIKSLPEVLEKFPKLILDIAGSGTRQEIKKIRLLVSSLNLESNVVFHGWIEKKRLQELLAASKLLILPSENENFAIVVSEALSLGKPCLVSNYVGAADIVAKHLAGVVIQELTSTSIAEGIIEVLQGDEVAYSEAAIKAAREDLDWSKIALQWKALVADLAYTKE